MKPFRTLISFGEPWWGSLWRFLITCIIDYKLQSILPLAQMWSSVIQVLSFQKTQDPITRSSIKWTPKNVPILACEADALNGKANLGHLSLAFCWLVLSLKCHCAVHQLAGLWEKWQEMNEARRGKERFRRGKNTVELDSMQRWLQLKMVIGGVREGWVANTDSVEELQMGLGVGETEHFWLISL